MRPRDLAGARDLGLSGQLRRCWAECRFAQRQARFFRLLSCKAFHIVRVFCIRRRLVRVRCYWLTDDRARATASFHACCPPPSPFCLIQGQFADRSKATTRPGRELPRREDERRWARCASTGRADDSYTVLI